MRTAEIVDLTNERRLSAALDFAQADGELLILNGGSRAEELIVVTVVEASVRTERRASYCIDSGTSMQLVVPLEAGESPDMVTLRIIGGHGEMLLSPAVKAHSRTLVTIRGWSTLAAAAVLLLLAGSRLDSQSVLPSADPEPASAEAPLVQPNVSLHVPARLPSVVARELPVRRSLPPVLLRPIRPVERHVAITLLAPTAAVLKRVGLPETPEPRMTDLRVPSTAKSGDFIPVAFGAVAHQVKIVASIGPTIVSKTIVGAQHGVIAIRSPKSDLDSRVMTVRAYAQNGNRTATLQAMVVLVHP